MGVSEILRPKAFNRIRHGSEWTEAVEDILTDKIVSLDFADLVLGKFLGSGISRYVFEFKPQPRRVIKIDTSVYNANVMEFNIWQAVEGNAVLKRPKGESIKGEWIRINLDEETFTVHNNAVTELQVDDQE